MDTLVPAYVFNLLFGRLPLICQLFSPERKGGLFSATFDVEGLWGDRRVRVSPLAAITPGILRGLFGPGDDAPDSGPRTEPEGPGR